jgi:hypothetical protein
MRYFGDHGCNVDRVEGLHRGRVVVSPSVVSNLCNCTRRIKLREIADADDANRLAERLTDELFESDRLRCDI